MERLADEFAKRSWDQGASRSDIWTKGIFGESMLGMVEMSGGLTLGVGIVFLALTGLTIGQAREVPLRNCF